MWRIMKTSDFTELLHRVYADAHRLNLFSMMAFSVQRSSAGSELACQRSLSSALDRYSVLAMSVRNYMGEDQRVRALRTDRSNAIPTQTPSVPERWPAAGDETRWWRGSVSSAGQNNQRRPRRRRRGDSRRRWWTSGSWRSRWSSPIAPAQQINSSAGLCCGSPAPITDYYNNSWRQRAAFNGFCELHEKVMLFSTTKISHMRVWWKNKPINQEE